MDRPNLAGYHLYMCVLPLLTTALRSPNVKLSTEKETKDEICASFRKTTLDLLDDGSGQLDIDINKNSRDHIRRQIFSKETLVKFLFK